MYFFVPTDIIEAVAAVDQRIFRPNPPANQRDLVNEELCTLVKQCWAEQPYERPGFDEISKKLRFINKGK
jgi:hypothetical protein